MDFVTEHLEKDRKMFIDMIMDSDVAEAVKGLKWTPEPKDTSEYFDWRQMSYLELSLLVDAKLCYMLVKKAFPEAINKIQHIKNETNDYYAAMNIVVPQFAESDSDAIKVILGAIHWIFEGYRLAGIESFIKGALENFMGEGDDSKKQLN